MRGPYEQMGPLGSLTSLKTKTKQLIWSLVHPQKWSSQRQPTLNLGSLLPGKLPFHHTHPFPNSPLTLLKADRQCPTHPSSLPIHSLIQQTLTGTHCVSVNVPGPGETGRPDTACFSALLGTGREPSLCSSHSGHAPHQASSSENHGFSISPS